MAKGAATENQLGALHSVLASIFLKVLEGYEKRLDTADKLINDTELEEDMLEAVLAANIEPSPAMLSAISKFLKDNDISVDREALNALTAQEQRLKNRQAARPDLKSITQLAIVDNG